MRLVLLYAAENWVLTGKLERLLVRCYHHRMLRYMAEVKCQDRMSDEEVQRCGVEDLKDRLRRARLRWFGHVTRREEGHILRRAVELEVAGKRLVGRPKKTWRQGVEEDLRCLNIRDDMVDDWQQCR